MSEDLKSLVEELSRVLGEVVKESDKVRALLRRIEESGADASVTLAIVLGSQGQGAEIQRILYGGERGQGQRGSQRRISAFDRRFLRALRIQLPD